MVFFGTLDQVQPLTEEWVEERQIRSWQDPVIDYISDPPETPNTGDRYIVKPTGSGDWHGHGNRIAVWTESGWVYSAAPSQGWSVLIRNTNRYLWFDGSAWEYEGTALPANAVTGVGEMAYRNWLSAPVQEFRDDPPEANVGDRFIIGIGTGVWAGHDNEVAEYSGPDWVFEVPTRGVTARVTVPNEYYWFTGTEWIFLESAYPRYASTGELNLNGDSIKGVDVIEFGSPDDLQCEIQGCRKIASPTGWALNFQSDSGVVFDLSGTDAVEMQTTFGSFYFHVINASEDGTILNGGYQVDTLIQTAPSEAVPDLNIRLKPSGIGGTMFESGWVQFGKLTDTEEGTITGSWGSNEAGRMWWNTTSNLMKYWDGSQIVTFEQVPV